MWALFTGLFFMHGALPMASCLHAAYLPVAMAAMSPAAAPEAGPSGRGQPTDRGQVSAAQGHPGDDALCACHGPCLSGEPRDSTVGFPAGLAAVSAAAARAAAPSVPATVVSPRAERPPGRPGLPLPLFLGVSRT